LASLRRRCATRTLHVRPVGRVKRTEARRVFAGENGGVHQGKWVLKQEKLGMGQNLVPLVNIKIAGKWMFIPLKMVCIGIDP
jgi:hypothetical protein